MIRSRFLAAAALTLAALTAWPVAASQVPPETTFAQYGAVLRFDSTGTPYVIDDGGHTPVGLSDPRVSADGLFLDLTIDPPLTRVVSGSVAMDETLTPLGVAAGPSIGLDTIRIRFARNGAAIPATDPILRARNANAFVSVTGLISTP